MSDRVTFRIDAREFDAALGQYMEVTKRAAADVLNKKALYIARGALRLTPSTPAATIKSSLGQVIRKKSGVEIKPVKAGAVYRGLSGRAAEAPLVALIINARRGRGGLPGLYGADMDKASQELISARNRSRAFIKSGWVPVIKTLAAALGSGPASSSSGLPSFGSVDAMFGFFSSGGAKQLGTPKGRALPAMPGFKCRAIIENAASGTHETHEALIKYGEPALQQAFNNEAASMLRFVADRQFQEARKIGIRAISG